MQNVLGNGNVTTTIAISYRGMEDIYYSQQEWHTNQAMKICHNQTMEGNQELRYQTRHQ